MSGPLPPPKHPELLSGSIRQLHARYRSGEIKPTELLEHTLCYLNQVEPRLNAFTTILSDADDQAAQSDEAVRAGGPFPSLTGVPVSVKDLVAVGGVRAPMGSRVLADHRPQHDSEVYRRLRAAGAVVFAKANMLELAAGFVHEDFAQSNNPWDTGRTAGGSSSGSAASVAAGIGYASVGSDTGGSVRLPSALCGIVGLKPTRSSISTDGVFPLAPTLDHVGLLTRSVADARLMYAVLSDSEVPVGGRTPARTFSIEGLRVGVIRELVDTDVSDDVRVQFDAAIAVLSECGVIVIDQQIPGIDSMAERTIDILLAEAAYQQRAWYPEHAADYSPGMRANLDAGRRLTALDYLNSLELRDGFRRTIDGTFTEVDVLACPTVAFTAPEREPDFTDAPRYVKRTFPFNVTGHPALTMPAGPCTGPLLPAGLQLIAPRHREELLFALGEVYEQHLGGFPMPWSPVE